MKCYDPQLIRNKYTGKWMYVPCGRCEICLMSSAVCKSAALGTNMLKSKYNIFVTFTYDNWNIPFVIDGNRSIYRLDYDGTIKEIEDIGFDVSCDGCHPLVNFPYDFESSKFVGVLYYRDFQLFLKRLRKKIYKNYGKYRKFSFFVTGELGTITQRPHFHAIFGFDDSEFKSFVSGILYSCWRMCDRSRFEAYIENAEVGAASYISSYVNCAPGCNAFLPYKRFKPFTRRSKDKAFGAYIKDEQIFETFLKTEYGKEVFDWCREDFIRTEPAKSSNSSLSFRLVPLSVFNRYFVKIKGFSNLSYINFLLLCYRVYELFRGQKEGGERWRYYKFEGAFRYDLTPFMPFIRCYFRLINLLSLVDNFSNFSYYVKFAYRIILFYDSCLLYLQMVEFNQSSALDYLYRQFNTFTSHLSKLQLNNIYSSLGLDYRPLSGFYCNSDKDLLRQFSIKYKQKLLPKHLNDYEKNFGYIR